MNKKILVSLSVIVGVALMVVGGTVANFFNKEVSSGNTLSMGVVDIVVDGQNPWTKTYSESLKDMKPSQTRYIVFTVRNLRESNEVKIWKHIDITEQSDGDITQPECQEGGGQWTGGSEPCTNPANCCATGYTPRNNLAAYTIYDLWVCYDPVEGQRCLTDPEIGEPSYGANWIPIIKEDQYVRLDNVSSAWIYLGQLMPAKELKVVQSYHVRSWPNAPEPEVTNWAQGDIMKFNIELYAEQLGGLGPKGGQALLLMENKDPVTWEPLTGDGISGQLTYNTSGEKFDYSLSGKAKNASTDYCLVYYADPWPGDGIDHSTGRLIGKVTSSGDGTISIPNTQVELSTDLPNSKDQNYPGGAKIWLIPCTHYSTDTVGSQGYMTTWTPSEYLFEMQFITYKDTGL